MRLISLMFFFFLLAPCKDLCFYKLRHKVTLRDSPSEEIRTGISEFRAQCGQQGAIWGRRDCIASLTTWGWREERGEEVGFYSFNWVPNEIDSQEISETVAHHEEVTILTCSIFFFLAHSLLPVFFFSFFKVCVQRDFLCASSTICPVKGNICL